MWQHIENCVKMTSSQENATPHIHRNTTGIVLLCRLLFVWKENGGTDGLRRYTMRALKGGGGITDEKRGGELTSVGSRDDVWRKVYAYSRLHMQRRDVFIQHVTSSGRVAAKWRADHLMRYINSCVYRPMVQSVKPIHQRLSSEQHPLKKERKETACQ